MIDETMSAVSLSGLIGREIEVDRVRSALDEVARHGQALHLVGDAGVGKSALLLVAIEEAKRRGFTVLSVRGTEAESHFGFAGLHRLLRPILDRTQALPRRHRFALLGAFGLADSEPPERLFVALAALELIADAAGESPVLVVVDDLPWVDNASRDAIEFVARRIEDEPAVVLLSSRSAIARPEGDIAPLLKLEALDEAASQQLLREHNPSLSPAHERRLLAVAAGNPLALLELPLAAAAGSPPEDPSRVGLTDRLEQAFAVRMDGLRPETRASLLVAALQDSDRLLETGGAVALLTGGREQVVDVEPAIAAGLLSSDGVSFRFRHPLVRSAIAHSASQQERRSVHLALAESLGAEPDRATWHRSLAATGRDDPLADELSEGADRAIAHGAPDVAKDWLERAAELSVNDGRRAHRLVRAAELAFELGRPNSVVDLMARARVLPLEPADYARLAGLEGAFDDGIPGGEDNVRRLVEAAQQAHGSGDEDVAVALLLGAAKACYWGAAEEPLRARVRGATESLSLSIADPRVMVIRALIDAFDCGAVLVEQLDEWAQRAALDVTLANALALTAFVTGDFDRGLFFATRASDGLRQQGRAALLTQALVLETFAALYLGRWDITKVASDEAYRFAVESGQPAWAACARLGQANLAALRGDDARALELAAEVEETGITSNNRALLNGVQLARGFAALGASRPGDAFNEFRRMVDPADVAYQSPQFAWAIDYLAESAEAAGRGEEALGIVRELDELTGRTPPRGIIRAKALANALLADGDQAEAQFDSARQLAATATPWYRARVDLAYGSWLRRQRRVAESRRPLAAAQSVFDALGASAWSTRAEQELGATGRHTRRRNPESWALLSAQELQIARLAAKGFSNREIGERLYLSHRTVASHLYRAFPKLGVRSRSQLHLALPDS